MAHLRDRRAFGNIGTRKFRGARFGDALSPRFSGLLDQYGGAAAAYSLRALSSGWLAGDVVEVRPSSGWTPASFTAGQVANGEMVDYVKRPGNFTNVDFETFSNNGTGDGFTATNSASTGFAYASTVSGAATDTVTVDFDITIISGSPAISLRNGAPPIAPSVSGTPIVISTSGSKSIMMTATGNFVNFTFSEGDVPAEFTVSNVRVSTNDGFVSKWYDQSGNANDATQATTTAQPKIVDAGALVVGGLDFDGVDDSLVTASTVLGDTFTSAMVVRNDSTPVSGSFFSQHQGGAANRFGLTADTTLPYGYRFFKQGLAPAFLDTTTDISSSDQLSFVVKSGVAVGMYIDGGANEGGNLGSSAILGALLAIGAAEEGAGGYGSFRASELILYNTDQSANRVGIETNINDFYTIY